MKRFRVLRYIAYTIEIIVFFIIQQTPGLIPSVYGILPTLLIPIACSIAMFEGPVCSRCIQRIFIRLRHQLHVWISRPDFGFDLFYHLFFGTRCIP